MIWLWTLLACTSPKPEVTVLAASSLTDVMADLEVAFEREHPDLDVRVSTGGSQTLTAQVRHGSPADVIASADAVRVHSLGDLVQGVKPIATTRLAVASRSGLDFLQLDRGGRVVLGDSAAPIGRYTDLALDAGTKRKGIPWRTEVDALVVSREPNVRLVLAKVLLGEADTAVVYETDFREGSGLKKVVVRPDIAPKATMVHGKLSGSPQPKAADLWMAFVESEAGRALFEAQGFGLP